MLGFAGQGMTEGRRLVGACLQPLRVLTALGIRHEAFAWCELYSGATGSAAAVCGLASASDARDPLVTKWQCLERRRQVLPMGPGSRYYIIGLQQLRNRRKC